MASLSCSPVRRLTVTYTWRNPALGKGHLYVRGGEWTHFSIKARSQRSIRKWSHTQVRLTAPLYSQWDSAAALCAPGHLVPRIQQQPAELPATGRSPNPESAPAPVLLPVSHDSILLHLDFQLNKSIKPTLAPPPPLHGHHGSVLK